MTLLVIWWFDANHPNLEKWRIFRCFFERYFYLLLLEIMKIRTFTTERDVRHLSCVLVVYSNSIAINKTCIVQLSGTLNQLIRVTHLFYLTNLIFAFAFWKNSDHVAHIYTRYLLFIMCGFALNFHWKGLSDWPTSRSSFPVANERDRRRAHVSIDLGLSSGRMPANQHSDLSETNLALSWSTWVTKTKARLPTV